jgi:hypothetical protein
MSKRRQRKTRAEQSEDTKNLRTKEGRTTRDYNRKQGQMQGQRGKKREKMKSGGRADASRRAETETHTTPTHGMIYVLGLMRNGRVARPRVAWPGVVGVSIIRNGKIRTDKKRASELQEECRTELIRRGNGAR